MVRTNRENGAITQLINASKPGTYPPEMEKIVVSHIEMIPEDDLYRIARLKPISESDIRCALENYLGTQSTTGYLMYQNELIPVFNRYSLLCYHATRIEDTASLLTRGIIADFEEYKQMIKSFLQKEKVAYDKIDSAMQAIEHEYSRKYCGRAYRICFFLNRVSLYNSDGSAGYDQFCETVGGELARWALEDRFPDVLYILQNKGIPAIIEFTIPFSRVADHHKDILISQFVYHLAAKHLWNTEYTVEADGVLNGNVPPESIIKISGFQ